MSSSAGCAFRLRIVGSTSATADVGRRGRRVRRDDRCAVRRSCRRAARPRMKPCVASKTVRVFHPQRREIVDVEKAAVVDLVGGHAPVDESERLRFEQRVQRLETRRAGRASPLISATRSSIASTSGPAGPGERGERGLGRRDTLRGARRAPRLPSRCARAAREAPTTSSEIAALSSGRQRLAATLQAGHRGATAHVARIDRKAVLVIANGEAARPPPRTASSSSPRSSTRP